MLVPRPIFAMALFNNREYLGGERERMLGSSFLNSLHAHVRSAPKGASPIGPQLQGEVFSPGSRGPNSPISSGLFGSHAARCAFHKLPHGKGLMRVCCLMLRGQKRSGKWRKGKKKWKKWWSGKKNNWKMEEGQMVE
jgi:hypothetical protein